MKKKILKVAIFSFVVAAAAISVDYGMNKANSSMSTLLSQVEAIASGEPAVTTWNCDASSSAECKASCLDCNVKVDAKGALSGGHTCKTN